MKEYHIPGVATQEILLETSDHDEIKMSFLHDKFEITKAFINSNSPSTGGMLYQTSKENDPLKTKISPYTATATLVDHNLHYEYRFENSTQLEGSESPLSKPLMGQKNILLPKGSESAGTLEEYKVDLRINENSKCELIKASLFSKETNESNNHKKSTECGPDIEKTTCETVSKQQ